MMKKGSPNVKIRSWFLYCFSFGKKPHSHQRILRSVQLSYSPQYTPHCKKLSSLTPIRSTRDRIKTGKAIMRPSIQVSMETFEKISLHSARYRLYHIVITARWPIVCQFFSQPIGHHFIRILDVSNVRICQLVPSCTVSIKGHRR